MMVKNFHQAPAEITTWWWVMKNQAWYAAELMSRCAVCWSAIRAPGEWEEGRAARHMRNAPEALCDLDTKTGRPSCSPQKLCYGSSEKNCSWPKAAPLFFSKMLEVFSLLPVKMKLHLLMISLLTEVAGWRQRFTGASCLPNAAGDTGGQRMV